ncbi:MAG: hypothetical protein KF813_07850 [Trueperaceae bacterium]|nr:hypothetical protein [Trueperaceae bacterium]
MSRLATRLLLPLLALTLFAACSQPSDPQPQRQEATVYVGPEIPTAVGAAMIMIDLSAMPILRSAAIEIFDGFYLSPLAPVAADGSVAFELPAAADVPAAVMTDVEYFLPWIDSFTGCTLEASNPSVSATYLLFELISIPGVAILTVEGLYLAVATSEPVTPTTTFNEILQSGLQSWVYADGATTVTTDPGVCPGDSGPSLAVDISLNQGWNLLEWEVGMDGSTVESLSLVNSTAEEIYLMAAGGL